MPPEIATTELMHYFHNRETPRQQHTTPETRDDQMLPPDVLRFGAHTLYRERVIGQGGEATVWLYTTHTEPRVYAAVKCARIPDDVLLEHQLHIVRRLEEVCGGVRGEIGHLNILESDDDEQRLIKEHMLVLPYINGISLASMMQRTQMDTETCAHIGVHMCNRIEELHEKSIVHADIKPENIMLIRPSGADNTAGLSVELIDFSHAANLLDGNHQHIPGGTPIYLSPEQWDALCNIESTVGTPTDVYAAGHTLFQMGTGTTLIPQEEGDTVLGLRMKHIECAVGRYDERFDLLPAALRPVFVSVFCTADKRPPMREITRRLRVACSTLGINPEEPLLPELNLQLSDLLNPEPTIRVPVRQD